MKVTYKHFRVWPANHYTAQRTGSPSRHALFHWQRGGDNPEWSERKPYPRGGRTICTIEIGSQTATGEAACSMSDQFCYRTGRRIARGRAVSALKALNAAQFGSSWAPRLRQKPQRPASLGVPVHMQDDWRKHLQRLLDASLDFLGTPTAQNKERLHLARAAANQFLGEIRK